MQAPGGLQTHLFFVRRGRRSDAPWIKVEHLLLSLRVLFRLAILSDAPQKDTQPREKYAKTDRPTPKKYQPQIHFAFLLS
jgi:hypothetical protein